MIIWHDVYNTGNQLALKVAQHVYLAGIATVLAIMIGLPIGIWIYYQPRVRGLILSITSVFQTIPSLALLAFLIPFLGIGTKPTIVTLTIYGLLPIVRNTLVGIQEVPEGSREAAKALGFRTWQRIRLVEIPLAMPTIISGIRTASAMNIGIATIAAFIGAGGLGDFITEGLSLDNNTLILLGAIPAALLALFVDYIIGQLESLMSYRSRQHMRFKRFKKYLIALCGLVFIGIIIQQNSDLFSSNQKKTIIIGSKTFTESFILSNIMADMIKAHTKLDVTLKLNLGSSAVTRAALSSGAIDGYADYTGTYYMNLMHRNKILNTKQTYDAVKRYSAKHYHIDWLKPFGFNNGTTIAIHQTFAKQHSITNLSQLANYAPTLTLAAPPEFFSRTDSYPALQKYYGLHFKKVVTMSINLMYRAIQHNQVDAILSFGTDAWLNKLDLRPLADNLHMYPPYQAVPLLNSDTAKQYPAVVAALDQLHNQISLDDIRQMNYLVDVKDQSPSQVAQQFLTRKHLI